MSRLTMRRDQEKAWISKLSAKFIFGGSSEINELKFGFPNIYLAASRKIKGLRLKKFGNDVCGPSLAR
jgi:hypothetical protein